MSSTAFAPGKIILSGEYAVIFGYPGIAIPSTLGIMAVFEEKPSTTIDVQTKTELGHPLWQEFVQKILTELGKVHTLPLGVLELSSTLPLGRGMGSSTALLIAIGRALGVTKKETLRDIENILTPGNSGLDFEVIWNEKPILLEGAQKTVIEFDQSFLKHAVLIDTGLPDQTTAELVRVIKEKKTELDEPLHTIMHCTQDLLAGKDAFEIFKKHQRAQVALGVVPGHVQQLIAGIEQAGGAAKVIGAGSRTGGGGMVLMLQKEPDVLSHLAALDYPVHSL